MTGQRATFHSGPVPATALCISLCTGVHSARPLIHGVGRGWWGARIRPRPPYVRTAGGQAGSDPVPQEAVCRDQRTGEVVQGHNKKTNKPEHRKQKKQTGITATATSTA